MANDPWRLSYIGSARVAFEDLAAQPPHSELSLDEVKLKGLLRVYSIQGCRNYDESTRLVSLIDVSELEGYCRVDHEGSVLPVTIKPTPPKKIYYQQGRHRLAAAACFLDPKNHSWGVDFYNKAAIPADLQWQACFDWRLSQKYSDGMTFRQLRLCKARGQHEEAKQWLGLFTATKQRDYRYLTHRRSLQPILSALDSLLGYEGLWQQFQFGTAHRWYTMRCYEEIESYLFSVKQTWNTIMQGLNTNYLDAQTVCQVQGRAPGRCTSDMSFVYNQIEKGEIFWWVSVEFHDKLKANLKSCEGIIPSLHTFLEDTKWLEPICAVVKSAFFPSEQLDFTLRRRLSMTFRYDLWKRKHPQLTVDQDAAFAHSYRQVWLAATRCWAELGKLKPRKEDRTTVLDLKPREDCHHFLMATAVNHAFQNRAITTFSQECIDRRTAESALQHVRPRAYYEVTQGSRESVIVNIQSILSNTKAIPETNVEQPRITYSRSSFDIRQRCGRMFQDSYRENSRNLTFENVYASFSDYGAGLSDFGVARDTFLKFFGSDTVLGLHDSDHVDEQSLQGETISKVLRNARPIVHNSTQAGPPPLQPPQVDIGTSQVHSVGHITHHANSSATAATFLGSNTIGSQSIPVPPAPTSAVQLGNQMDTTTPDSGPIAAASPLTTSQNEIIPSRSLQAAIMVAEQLAPRLAIEMAQPGTGELHAQPSASSMATEIVSQAALNVMSSEEDILPMDLSSGDSVMDAVPDLHPEETTRVIPARTPSSQSELDSNHVQSWEGPEDVQSRPMDDETLFDLDNDTLESLADAEGVASNLEDVERNSTNDDPSQTIEKHPPLMEGQVGGNGLQQAIDGDSIASQQLEVSQTSHIEEAGRTQQITTSQTTENNVSSEPNTTPPSADPHFSVSRVWQPSANLSQPAADHFTPLSEPTMSNQTIDNLGKPLSETVEGKTVEYDFTPAEFYSNLLQGQGPNYHYCLAEILESKIVVTYIKKRTNNKAYTEWVSRFVGNGFQVWTIEEEKTHFKMLPLQPDAKKRILMATMQAKSNTIPKLRHNNKDAPTGLRECANSSVPQKRRLLAIDWKRDVDSVEKCFQFPNNHLPHDVFFTALFQLLREKQPNPFRKFLAYPHDDVLVVSFVTEHEHRTKTLQWVEERTRAGCSFYEVKKQTGRCIYSNCRAESIADSLSGAYLASGNLRCTHSAIDLSVDLKDVGPIFPHWNKRNKLLQDTLDSERTIPADSSIHASATAIPEQDYCHDTAANQATFESGSDEEL